MEQSNLLELAKQGEPTAIAALMNAVLEPTGIVAQARLDTGCLWVVLESPKALNQETLTTFIHKGLLELGNESIRSLKVQGKKIGEPSFAWTRELEIYPEKLGTERRELTVSEAIGTTDEALPSVGAVALKEKPEPIAPTPTTADEETSEPDGTETFLGAEFSTPEVVEIATESPALEITSLSALEKLIEVKNTEPDAIATLPEDEANSIELTSQSPAISDATEQIERDPIAAIPETIEDVTDHSNVETPETIEPTSVATTPETEEEETVQDTESEEEDALESATTFRAWLKTYWQVYSLPVLLVVVSGFVLGSAVAFWSTTQTQGNSLTLQKETPEDKQKEAEDYLKAMNSAQEAFYQKNKRFATSLEELERSANLISQSYSYAYQLRVSDRSLITALPRETGLKSYAGAVFVAPVGTKSLICHTIKSSMQAPTAPLFNKKKATAACAPRSLKVQ